MYIMRIIFILAILITLVSIAFYELKIVNNHLNILAHAVQNIQYQIDVLSQKTLK